MAKRKTAAKEKTKPAARSLRGMNWYPKLRY
jgi:hypothetical protein